MHDLELDDGYLYISTYFLIFSLKILKYRNKVDDNLMMSIVD